MPLPDGEGSEPAAPNALSDPVSLRMLHPITFFVNVMA
jgi:hypothetical protein